ncbi:hypothetical protein [Pelagicoccus mobilis]|uniref:hypothetical protein n=1 Tax=Pelagicoccus mobilis TaxID=415221 RepID=UPI0035EFDA5A
MKRMRRAGVLCGFGSCDAALTALTASVDPTNNFKQHLRRYLAINKKKAMLETSTTLRKFN